MSTTVDPLDITAAVAQRFGLPLEDLLGPSRLRRVTAARSCAYVVLRRMTDLSLPAIGRVMGRGHWTVLSVIRHVEADPAALAVAEELVAALTVAVPAPVDVEQVTPAAGWRHLAACAGLDPDLFHAPAGGTMDPGQEAEARSICASCPVRAACLAWALGAGSDALGIAGGTSLKERQKMQGHVAANPEREERIVAAARLRSTGMDVRHIAAQLGVTPKSVHRYLNAAQPVGVAS